MNNTKKFTDIFSNKKDTTNYINNNDIKEESELSINNRSENEEINTNKSELNTNDKVQEQLVGEINFLKKELEILETNLINTTKDVLLEKADKENLRKRYERELEQGIKYAISQFARDLIDIRESLYQAVNHISLIDNPSEHIENILKGTKMTVTMLEAAMRKNGVERLYPENEDFDHKYHQAISHVSTDEYEENKIIRVYKAGYLLQDRLLEPALVEVAKKNN